MLTQQFNLCNLKKGDYMNFDGEKYIHVFGQEKRT